MKTSKLFKLAVIAALAIASLLVTSCNTLHGAGRDVQNVGSAVSHM